MIIDLVTDCLALKFVVEGFLECPLGFIEARQRVHFRISIEFFWKKEIEYSVIPSRNSALSS